MAELVDNAEEMKLTIRNDKTFTIKHDSLIHSFQPENENLKDIAYQW